VLPKALRLLSVRLGLLAVFGGATVAQIASADSPLTWPGWTDLPRWLLTAPNPWLLVTSVLTAFGGVASVVQLFASRPATGSEIGQDGRKTRADVALLSQKISEESLTSHSRHLELLSALQSARVGVTAEDIRAGRISDEVRAELIAALGLSIEAQTQATAEQARAFAETAADLAQSSAADDRSIAAQIVEGYPLEATDRLIGSSNFHATNAERVRMAARLYTPFSTTKAIAAYTDALELDPTHSGTWAELARLYHYRGSREDARRCAERAAELAADPWNIMIAEGLLGDVAQAEGQLDGAASHYRRAHDLARTRLNVFPGDKSGRHELSNYLQKLGQVSTATGNLSAAARYFKASVRITSDLSAAQPNDPAWQRELSVSHNWLGDALWDAGRRFEAQKEYEAALIIRQALARGRDSNWLAQRDLSVSCVKMGDVLSAGGQFSEAHEHYKAALAIRERLVAADPDNFEHRRDLARSHSRLRAIAIDLEHIEEARQHSYSELSISRDLAKEDPGNIRWRADLARAHENLAGIQLSDGKLDSALHNLAESLEIREALAKIDPTDLKFKHALWKVHELRGESFAQARDFAKARNEYMQGYALVHNLVLSDPANAQWQGDFATAVDRLGEMAMVVGDFDGAQKYFTDSLARREQLFAADSSEISLLQDLFISHAKLAQLCEINGNIVDAVARYRRAREIIESAISKAPDYPKLKGLLSKVNAVILRLGGS